MSMLALEQALNETRDFASTRGALREYHLANSVVYVPSRSIMRSIDWRGQIALLVDGSIWIYDEDDTTSADDGVLVLVDAKGHRYKFEMSQAVEDSIAIGPSLTRATLAGAKVPAGQNSVTTGGYAVSGDGGAARYKRVTSEPSHELKVRSLDRYLPNGTESAGNGGWWEIDENTLAPAMAGGDPTGVADSSGAINDILDYLRAKSYTLAAGFFITPRVVDGSGGIYAVETSLNMTALRMFSVVFRNMVLLGKCTGKAVCDLTHSRFTKWDNVTIWGDAVNTPSVGIMLQRGVSNQSADCHSFDDLNVLGNYTRASMHNYASETNTYKHIRLWNSQSGKECLILDGLGGWGEESEYWPIASGAQSCLENLFVQGDLRQLTSGPTIRMRSCPHTEFQNSYAVSFDDVIVNAYGNNARMSLWRFDLHAEAGPNLLGFMRFHSSTGNISFDNFYYADNRPNSPTGIFLIDASVTNLVFRSLDVRIGDWYNSTAPTSRMFDTPGVVSIRGAKLSIPTIGGLNKISAFANFSGKIEAGDVTREMMVNPMVWDDDDGATANVVQFYRRSDNPLTGDALTSLAWLGHNSNADAVTYGQLGCIILDPTDGAEKGMPQMQVMKAGAVTATFQWLGEFTETLVPFRLPTYTRAQLLDGTTLPPADHPRCIVYVSDGASSKLIAVSSGGAWRYMDGVAVT